MTADEVVDAALARCTDLGLTVPATRSVYYRRIGVRQGQIFSAIASAHPEYLGTTAVKTLVNGQVQLSGFNPKAERIVDIRVADPGSSGLVAKERVNIVLIDDVDAQLPPRVTIRDGIIAGVEGDLNGVASLTIYYSRQPTVLAIAKTTQMELPDQFQDLLVIDLSKQMIRKLLDVEPGRRDGWIDLLSAEEKSLLGTLDDHVRYFSHGEQNRFRPPSPPPPGSDT